MGRPLMTSPLVAVGIALVLLAAGLSLALHNETVSRNDRVRQVSVQAEILANSVAAPLAFDDEAATRQYINAMRANPDVQAVGVYDAAGRLTVGYSRTGQRAPAANRVRPPAFEGGDLAVTAPVAEGATTLGSVYLRTATDSWARRASRYLGIALLVFMASLLVAVLGASYASMREANLKLQAEMTGRQEAEAALRQAQKMEAMGQLVGGVAHDFNNLLMVASSGLDLMDRTADPGRRERLKQGIRQSIDRGAALTQQLLAFARRSPLHPQVIDLAARLEGLHDLLDRSLREDIIVDIQADKDLWPVEADPSQLEVALLNIALNARDAMPSGGAIFITAKNEPAGDGTGDRVRLSIRDTGVGASPEMVAKVFEPFFTTKSVGQGTGLGLSQVYGFARSSGGDVAFQSQLGAGATVSLLLPRSAKTLPAEAKPADARVAVAERRSRVLVVEDDDNVAELVAEMLTELGYETSRAATADAALERLDAEEAFDVVFSDMVMPGEMNGLDLAHEIARCKPELPIVLTSGYSAAATSAADEGIKVLLKPYRIEALAAELQTALDRRPRQTTH